MEHKPIAYMTADELRQLTPEQMVETILDDNFDRDSALARGMALNLSKDILDCLLAYGAARAAAERERMRVAIARLRANPPGIDGDTYGAAQFNAGIDAAIATTRAFD